MTWYDRDHNVVWLLAAQIHRQGSRDDAYTAAVAREQAGRLYPTPADYEALADAEKSMRIEAEARARDMRERVLANPADSRQRYESLNGLYAELWAEKIPGLALVLPHMRIYRQPMQWLSNHELAIFLEAVYAQDEHSDIGDADRRFRRFEGYHVIT